MRQGYKLVARRRRATTAASRKEGQGGNPASGAPAGGRLSSTRSDQTEAVQARAQSLPMAGSEARSVSGGDTRQ